MRPVARFDDMVEAFRAEARSLEALAAAYFVFKPRTSQISARLVLAHEHPLTRQAVEKMYTSVARRFEEFRFDRELVILQEGTDPSGFQPVIESDWELRKILGPAAWAREESKASSHTEKVLRALSNPKYDWRTVDGVSRETGLDRSIVLQIIEGRSDQIIRSRVRDAQGRDLYATRRHYRERHSPAQRFLDQLRSTSI